MSMNDRRATGQSPFSPDFSETSSEEEPFFVEIEETPEPPPPPPAANVDQRPEWFRGPTNQEQAPAPTKPAPPPPPVRGPGNGQGQQNPRRQRIPIVAAPEEETEENRTWQERFKRWVLGEGGAGFGVSVVVHIILILMMSLWILVTPKDEELITTLDETEVVDLASIQDVEIEDLDTDFEEQIKDPLFDPAPLSAPDIGINSLASSLVDTKGGGLDIQLPKQAVTKGSFTVWTDPEDPMPGQQYVIMIQIKLDNNLKRYPRRDLSGNVVGTDGYKDYFGGPTEAGYLPVLDNTVRMKACIVPGAAQLVKDVITVESKILGEKQVIDIVF